MSTRFVNIDRETPMLLPVDLREWVRGDDLAHFVLLRSRSHNAPQIEKKIARLLASRSKSRI